MSTVTEAIKRVGWNGSQHVAVAIWCEDDVLEKAKEMGVKCSRARAREIIDKIDRQQDCPMGITWDTIGCFVAEVE